jgi:alkyl sulfatase BDS1-like metallo-beta-lactamase superfamily hydrolase
MKNIFSQFFDTLFGSGKAWWIEVKTAEPACTYYFGPFDVEQEADLAKKGYIEDLEQEGAKQVEATVIYRQAPQELTVYNEQMDDVAPDPKPVFSGQS